VRETILFVRTVDFWGNVFSEYEIYMFFRFMWVTGIFSALRDYRGYGAFV